MSLPIQVWEELHQRVRSRLAEAGIHVQPGELAGIIDHRSGVHFGKHPTGMSYILLDVVLPDRARAVSVISATVGPEYAVRYHRHPDAHPQDVVFVFEADNVWPDEVWTESNVRRGKANKKLKEKSVRGGVASDGRSLLDDITAEEIVDRTAT
jgi:hypothetical protein